MEPFDVLNNFSVSKISDNRWTLSKAALLAQSKSCSEVEGWNVHGLSNYDSCSDYVNVILQSLFNCENLRRVLSESKDNSYLKIIYELYKSRKYINTKELRNFVNHKYLKNLKYDVSEFLIDLVEKMPTLQHVLRHEIVRILRCTGCDERQATNLMLQCIICLSVPTANQPFDFTRNL